MDNKISKWRGHEVIVSNGEMFYVDTGEKSYRRDCGHCGKSDTIDGHDGCLGEIPDIMNACCGHGIVEDAYIQYWDGTTDDGQDALDILNQLKGKDTI